MKNDNWNKHVMDGIMAVNRNLHKGGFLPEKARQLLYGLESCLCSGDGLSPETAFRARDERVAERAVELLGMNAFSYLSEQDSGTAEVPVGENPYEVHSLFFTIEG
jgi:hypothetical protein